MEIFGIRITRLTLDEVVERIRSVHEPLTISTLSLPLARDLVRLSNYRNAIESADLVVPDGIGIVMASRWLYGSHGLSRRVTGPDLFLRYLEFPGDRNKVFLLGSRSAVLSAMLTRLARDYPQVEVVGAQSPPMAPWTAETNERILRDVNGSGADVLWVAMSAPKQEMWVYQNRDAISVPVVASVGAAFDFFAGTVPRAPRMMRRMGLEWLYRSVKEPFRVGLRYPRGIPYFLYLLFRSRARRRPKRDDG